MTHRNWKEFEQLMTRIHKDIASDADVEHDVRRRGLSGRLRQLDVTISTLVGLYPTLIVIECKRYSRKVSIEKVEAFASKCEDVQASHGVMISNTGFDAGAVAVAKRKGITLLSYREATFVDWASLTKSESWVKIILSRADLLQVDVEAESESELEMRLDTQLLTEDGQPFLSIQELSEQIREQTHVGGIPREVKIEAIADPPLFVRAGGELAQVTKITPSYRVRAWEYTINLKLASGHVLEDEQGDGPVLQQFTTESWDMRQLVQNQSGRELSADDFREVAESGRIRVLNVPVKEAKPFYRLVVTKQRE